MGTISPHVDAETPDDAVDIAAHLEKLIPPLELVRMDPDAPEYDATVDQFKFDSLGHLKTLQAFVRSQSADAAPMDTQWEEMTWFTLLRLDGPSEFQSVQGRLLVQDCLANLAQPNDLFHSLLLHKIKPVFASAPHPDVNHETGRKLSVPAGGARARLDRFNEQSWKQASEYGIVNALRGCLQRMTEEQVTQEMALVLPPLLTIMDDWDTQYRLQGLECLEVLLDKVAPVTMKRMGIDQLFLKSIQHSISLHPTPPSPPMLESALSSLFRLLDLIMDPATDEYANQVSLAVEQGVIDGWQYAPSGMPGLEVMIEIGVGVEMLCEKVGVGMIRWLNDLIPGLLSSSYSPPSPLSIGLQLTNLHALHVLLTTIQSTCRAERWQGQIIDALGRNWVGIDEKRKMLELSGSDAMEQDQFQVTQDEMETVQELLRTVLGDLVETSPELRKNELLHLLELSPEAFGGFVKGFVDSSPSATTTTSTAPPPLPVRPGGTTSPPPPPLPARNPLSQGSPMQEVHQDEPSARRFVAPLSASGTARPVQPPPQRQVEPVEQATPPPVDSSRVGQARQQANDIYKQYKPLVRQRQDEAKQAASTFSEFAGRLIKGDHQQGRDQSQSGYGMGGSGTGSNPGGTAAGGAHREDLERMGQQALRGLNRVGKQVAGGIDRFQQQMQAGK